MQPLGLHYIPQHLPTRLAICSIVTMVAGAVFLSLALTEVNDSFLAPGIVNIASFAVFGVAATIKYLEVKTINAQTDARFAQIKKSSLSNVPDNDSGYRDFALLRNQLVRFTDQLLHLIEGVLQVTVQNPHSKEGQEQTRAISEFANAIKSLRDKIFDDADQLASIDLLNDIFNIERRLHDEPFYRNPEKLQEIEQQNFELQTAGAEKWALMERVRIKLEKERDRLIAEKEELKKAAQQIEDEFNKFMTKEFVPVKENVEQATNFATRRWAEYQRDQLVARKVDLQDKVQAIQITLAASTKEIEDIDDRLSDVESEDEVVKLNEKIEKKQAEFERNRDEITQKKKRLEEEYKKLDALRGKHILTREITQFLNDLKPKIKRALIDFEQGLLDPIVNDEGESEPVQGPSAEPSRKDKLLEKMHYMHNNYAAHLTLQTLLESAFGLLSLVHLFVKQPIEDRITNRDKFVKFIKFIKPYIDPDPPAQAGEAQKEKSDLEKLASPEFLDYFALYDALVKESGLGPELEQITNCLLHAVNPILSNLLSTVSLYRTDLVHGLATNSKLLDIPDDLRAVLMNDDVPLTLDHLLRFLSTELLSGPIATVMNTIKTAQSRYALRDLALNLTFLLTSILLLTLSTQSFIDPSTCTDLSTAGYTLLVLDLVILSRSLYRTREAKPFPDPVPKAEPVKQQMKPERIYANFLADQTGVPLEISKLMVEYLGEQQLSSEQLFYANFLADQTGFPLEISKLMVEYLGEQPSSEQLLELENPNPSDPDFLDFQDEIRKCINILYSFVGNLLHSLKREEAGEDQNIDELLVALRGIQDKYLGALRRNEGSGHGLLGKIVRSNIFREFVKVEKIIHHAVSAASIKIMKKQLTELVTKKEEALNEEEVDLEAIAGLTVMIEKLKEQVREVDEKMNHSLFQRYDPFKMVNKLVFPNINPLEGPLTDPIDLIEGLKMGQRYLVRLQILGATPLEKITRVNAKFACIDELLENYKSQALQFKLVSKKIKEGVIWEGEKGCLKELKILHKRAATSLEPDQIESNTKQSIVKLKQLILKAKFYLSQLRMIRELNPLTIELIQKIHDFDDLLAALQKENENFDKPTTDSDKNFIEKRFDNMTPVQAATNYTHQMAIGVVMKLGNWAARILTFDLDIAELGLKISTKQLLHNYAAKLQKKGEHEHPLVLYKKAYDILYDRDPKACVPIGDTGLAIYGSDVRWALGASGDSPGNISIWRELWVFRRNTEGVITTFVIDLLNSSFDYRSKVVEGGYTYLAAVIEDVRALGERDDVTIVDIIALLDPRNRVSPIANLLAVIKDPESAKELNPKAIPQKSKSERLEAQTIRLDESILSMSRPTAEMLQVIPNEQFDIRFNNMSNEDILINLAQEVIEKGAIVRERIAEGRELQLEGQIRLEQLREAYDALAQVRESILRRRAERMEQQRLARLNAPVEVYDAEEEEKFPGFEQSHAVQIQVPLAAEPLSASSASQNFAEPSFEARREKYRQTGISQSMT